MLQSRDVSTEFSRALIAGRGSIFVGSGISTPSGVPGWGALLKDMARTRLNLSLLPDDDLPQVAQYIVNESGTRGPLVAHFRDLLEKTRSQNRYHAILTRTNVKRFWTTNYDTLLEDGFRRHFDVMVRASDESMSRGATVLDVEVIKMHGCVKQSEGKDLVVTQEDYEDFFERRPATTNRLKQDLLDRQFLFIGYSYADSHIRNILVEARRLGKRALRQHYMVIRRQKVGSASEVAARQARQDLWLTDLSRLGIAACQIDEFGELEEILENIALHSRGNTVFVTGSHRRVEQDGTSHPEKLGALLAEQENLVLLDGQSAGTGRFVMASYMEKCLSMRVDVVDRLRLFSNPYAANPKFSDDPRLLTTLQAWRAPLMRSAQVVVVYDGGMGTEAEVQLAKDLGCQILPVPEAESDLPSRLLNEPAISSTLQAVDADYVSKARTHFVSAQDVAECLRRMLRK